MTLEVCLQPGLETPVPEKLVSVSKMAYSKRDAASTLSISVRKLDYMIERGEIKVRRIGKRVVITHQELQQFLRRDHVTARVQ
jgi:excisionase family DNA binding protein